MTSKFNRYFEEEKLQIISKLVKLEKNEINSIFLGEISGFLKSLEWQQMFSSVERN